MSARRRLFAAAVAAGALLAPSAAFAQSDEDDAASSPDEWNAAPEDAAVAEAWPPFDASGVAVDPRLRFELRAGLWMVEDAGRLRSSNPALGLGINGRISESLRYDAGYLFTWVQDGTQRLNVLNLHHAVRGRVHYAHRIGGAWLTVGAGPAAFVMMSTGPETPFGVGFNGGLDGAVGIETQVDERLVRFELGASARGLPRVLRTDLHCAVVIGF